MKKVLALFLAGLLMFMLCACGETNSDTNDDKNDDTKQEANDDVKDDESKEDEPKGLSSTVTVNGTALTLGGEFTDAMLEALGEPENILEAPSCHYDGTDSLYYYSGFTLYTYMLEDKSILYSIELNDSTYPTPEGVKVGMTVDEVKAICGNSFDELVNGISYPLGERMVLNLRAPDGTVTIIEYYTE